MRSTQQVSRGRRSFLERLGLGGLLVGLGGGTYQSLRSLVPNVLYEAPRRFKVGTPTDLAEGTTFVEAQRLFVFKEEKSFHSISAICTSLRS